MKANDFITIDDQSTLALRKSSIIALKGTDENATLVSLKDRPYIKTGLSIDALMDRLGGELKQFFACEKMPVALMRKSAVTAVQHVSWGAHVYTDQVYEALRNQRVGNAMFCNGKGSTLCELPVPVVMNLLEDKDDFVDLSEQHHLWARKSLIAIVNKAGDASDVVMRDGRRFEATCSLEKLAGELGGGFMDYGQGIVSKDLVEGVSRGENGSGLLLKWGVADEVGYKGTVEQAISALSNG